MKALFWAAFGIAATWFLVSDLIFVAGRDLAEQGVRWLGYVAHVASALPVLVIAPLQFSGVLRRARPGLHRSLGRVFLASAIISGCFAVWLGATMPREGTQIPLMLFGALWVCFAGAAWLAARRRRWVEHRAFVVRTFAIATSFLWLHLLQEGEASLFWFIESEDVRYATRGWLSLVVPVLVAETYLSWWPAFAKVRR